MLYGFHSGGWGVLVDEVKGMRSDRLWTWGLFAVVAGVIGPSMMSAQPRGPVLPAVSVNVLRDVESSAVASSPRYVSAINLPEPLAASDVHESSTSGGAAGAPIGSTRVYSNTTNAPTYYPPGRNQRMADDLTLAGGLCNAVYYNLAVNGGTLIPIGQNYSLHTELWTGDPCLPSSTAISGTERDFTITICPTPPCPPNPTRRASLQEAVLDPPIPIPGTVWLAATFSHDDAGWIVAGEAEIGSTQNRFSEDDDAVTCTTSQNCTNAGYTGYTCQGGICQLCSGTFGLTESYSGFWAEVFCETVVPPNGACCNGTTCTQTTEADCLSPGVWQGAFTTCQPNACLAGACCTGVDFEDCADANEAACPVGLFRPGTVCVNNPCGESFEVYRNDFSTRRFEPIGSDEKWADDLTLGAGAPCQLVAYEVLMAGGEPQTCAVGFCDVTSDPCIADSDCPPKPFLTFDAHVELWTNDNRGTPGVDSDDTPLAVIPGTERNFIGRTADFTRQQLLAGPFSGIQIPPPIPPPPPTPLPAPKVWMVVTTNKDTAGPIFGGLADPGFSQDGFAIFGDHDTNPLTPFTWESGFHFGTGFNPTNCPFDPSNPTCVPAGSFRAIVWCEGAPPRGACCNDIHGMCTDGVLSTDCEGRWMGNVTCESNPFDPPCGAHACCYPNPINPNGAVVCQDLTPLECTDLEGSSAPGLFCVDVTCPVRACINRVGDCFGQHGTTGCDNAFCCEKVCAADPSCCTTDWDSLCADRARILCSSDQCTDALPISGEGTIAFDNTTATTDGPIHNACATTDAPEKQIQKDVWYCWTAPCTDTVFVRTCGQTAVDTKLAVYDGCACPPTDAALLDCGDDRCGSQSTAVFHAVAGQSYLIRLGNYPGQSPGTGSFTMDCGAPNQLACPGTGGCCTAETTPAPGCVDEACCERVCGCDAYCCDTVWDQDCATTGYQGSGCGADALCPSLCGACSAGTVTFNSPSPGVLDARRPFPPSDETQLLGIDAIQVTAPAGADLIGCWTVCETASNGAANGIANITDNGGGEYTIRLARPITPGAVTKITYKGNGAFARYIAHPANLNLDGFANAMDVDALVKALKGETPLPAGLLSADVDFSGAITGADILDTVGLLIGEGDYPIGNNSPKPEPNVNCP